MAVSLFSPADLLGSSSQLVIRMRPTMSLRMIVYPPKLGRTFGLVFMGLWVSSAVLAETENFTPIFLAPIVSEGIGEVELAPPSVLEVLETFPIKSVSEVEDFERGIEAVETFAFPATAEEPDLDNNVQSETFSTGVVKEISPELPAPIAQPLEFDPTLPVELFAFQEEFASVWSAGYTGFRARMACERQDTLKTAAARVAQAPIFEMTKGSFDSWRKHAAELEAVVTEIANRCGRAEIVESEVNDLLVKTHDLWSTLLRIRT